MTFVAESAPQKLRKLATDTTDVVVPDQVIIVPMHIESTNWARKTMLLTIAMSVPRPRATGAAFFDDLFPSNWNMRLSPYIDCSMVSNIWIFLRFHWRDNAQQGDRALWIKSNTSLPPSRWIEEHWPELWSGPWYTCRHCWTEVRRHKCSLL